MCEATVFVKDHEGEREIMRDVALVRVAGDEIILSSLLGEQKLVLGRIEKIDLIKHSVHLTDLSGGTAVARR